MDFPQLHPSSGQAPHTCKSSVTLRANLSLPLREKDLDGVGPTGDQVPESFYTEGRGRVTPGSPSSPDPILKPFSAPAHTCLLTALVPMLAPFGQKGPHDCLKVRPAVSTWKPSWFFRCVSASLLNSYHVSQLCPYLRPWSHLSRLKAVLPPVSR